MNCVRGNAYIRGTTPEELPAIHGLRVVGEFHSRPWPGETDSGSGSMPDRAGINFTHRPRSCRLWVRSGAEEVRLAFQVWLP